jgi:tetratricopeptide (TPR) repeat protein
VVLSAGLPFACATHLTPDRLGFYLNDVGLYATDAGDLATAHDYLTLAVRHDRDAGGIGSLAADLQNLADCLGHLGLVGPAREAAAESLTCAEVAGRQNDVRNSHALLGWLAGLAGDTTAAAAAFRDGDHLTEFAEALPSLAAVAQAAGDLDTAQRHLAEAITIAAPRALIPAHATALAARARLRAAQATATGDTDALSQGRDDAYAARRLAIRHRLPWHELEALTAHTALDEAEGTSHDWAAQAGQLHAQLTPPGFDPDPLATVERLVKAQKASEDDAGDNDPGNPGR